MINLIIIKQNKLLCGKSQKTNDTVEKYCCNFCHRKWLITLIGDNLLAINKKKEQLDFKNGQKYRQFSKKNDNDP